MYIHRDYDKTDENTLGVVTGSRLLGMLGRNSSELDGEGNAVPVYLMASANGRFFIYVTLLLCPP